MYVRAEQRQLLDAVSSSHSLSPAVNWKQVVQTVLALAGDRREKLSAHVCMLHTVAVATIRGWC